MATTNYYGSEILSPLGNVSGAVTVNLATASTFTMTLTGNTVITFSNSVDSSKVNVATFRVTQGGAGSYTLDITGRQGSFGANALANLSTAIGAVDKILCESWDGGAHWDVALTGQSIS